jgi:hypothetical protein
LAGGVRPIRFDLPNIVNNVTFSNDGKTLAAVCNFPDGALRLWDVGKWVEVILPGHSSHVGGLAASPAGPLWVTGSEDGTIRFWDRTAKGLPPYSIGPGMFGGEVLPAFSPMSRYLVTGNANGTISILRVPTRPPGKRVTDSGLIKNGGFEAGLEGWKPPYISGPPPKFEFDREVVREGWQSLRVTAPGAAEVNCTQMVVLKPGQWYRFSGWVRTRGLKAHGDSTSWGTILITHPGDWRPLAKGDNHQGDTEWTPISLRFQAPDDGKVDIFLTPAYCDHRPTRFFGGSGTIWFDGLKLVEESQSAR